MKYLAVILALIIGTPSIAYAETRVDLLCNHMKYIQLRTFKEEKGTKPPQSLTIFPDSKEMGLLGKRLRYKEIGNFISYLGPIQTFGTTEEGAATRWEFKLDRVTGVWEEIFWHKSTHRGKYDSKTNGIKLEKQPKGPITPFFKHVYICKKIKKLF